MTIIHVLSQGMMGNPLYVDEVGKMCFNPAKNFQVCIDYFFTCFCFTSSDDKVYCNELTIPDRRLVQ